MPQAPVPQKPLPQAGAAHAGSLVLVPALMKPAEISFSTGAAGSVVPAGIPACSHSSPQVASLSAMACRTSIVRSLDAQRYSYVGTVSSPPGLHAKYSRSVAPAEQVTQKSLRRVFSCVRFE